MRNIKINRVREIKISKIRKIREIETFKLSQNKRSRESKYLARLR